MNKDEKICEKRKEAEKESVKSSQAIFYYTIMSTHVVPQVPRLRYY